MIPACKKRRFPWGLVVFENLRVAVFFFFAMFPMSSHNTLLQSIIENSHCGLKRDDFESDEKFQQCRRTRETRNASDQQQQPPIHGIVKTLKSGRTISCRIPRGKQIMYLDPDEEQALHMMKTITQQHLYMLPLKELY